VVAKAVSSTADVTSVATLDAAREALAANRVDLVMLDAGRPTMCGLELLPELHDSDRNAIPVIVLSAEGMNTTWALQIGYALNKTTSAIQGPIPEMSCVEVQGA
jgi:DNA-binding response OmpR family regulator